MTQAHRDFLIHFLIGVVFAGILIFGISQFSPSFTNMPFKKVTLLSQEVNGDWVHYKFAFTKLGCVYKRLEVLGISQGRVISLPWENIDEQEQLATGQDRIKGYHIWSVKVQIKSIFDYIEIRTRHECNGKITDRIFAKVSAKDK